MHRACNTGNMQQQCNVHNKQHGTAASNVRQPACNLQVRHHATRIMQQQRKTCNRRHATCKPDNMEQTACNVQRCNTARCNLQHAALQHATTQRQRATRSTFGLDRTRWRRSHRRSCKSPALEPRYCMRLPRGCANAARNGASRQQAAHRTQAASPDLECGRRRARAVVRRCCCCWAVVSGQRSGKRASPRERAEPRA